VRAYIDAEKNQALVYQRILRPKSNPTRDMLACLAGGLPFVSGIVVYESFESDVVSKTGIIPMPTKDETVLGGHAIVAVGYDVGKQHFICRNSWGTRWGDRGYFYLPFAYLEDAALASDQWVIQTVEV
jgi:C1A family cysteine protease